jgi:transposase InsO family protein
MPYEMPGHLERAITNFVNYYNYPRYHKALGNVTLMTFYRGKRIQY